MKQLLGIEGARRFTFSVWWEARDEETADVLDLEQWGFYAVLSTVLEATFGDQKTFGLSSLEKVATRVPSAELKATVDKLHNGALVL